MEQGNRRQTRPMTNRGTWQGMLTIGRLNWPFYLIGSVIGVLLVAGALGSSSPPGKMMCALAALGAFYFLIGSLAVSHWIYDRSDLYRWKWLQRALPGPVERIAFCHTGFDEASSVLREKFAGAQWHILDHYDASRMTEPSIRRARRLHPPAADTLPCSFDQWPVETKSLDAVFALLAIHELRTETERTAWFAEASRRLKIGGRILLVEHLRDLPNLLAFGPGFLHFHSRHRWHRCWQSAGLRAVDEFHLTPWIRVFVIGHHG